jgi:protein-S-isoprenylcysteine O-methyltransferase Ste14
MRDATIARAALETLGFGMLLALALLLPAGDASWPMAWAFLGCYAAFSIAGFLLMPRDLIAERSRLPADAKRADLCIAGLAMFFLVPATLVVCGFDFRWRASPGLPPVLRASALALFALGYALSLWAAHVNPFFSAVVRVQSERRHRVVASGPYAFVRHPGYAGPLIGHLALPIALGSLWGVLPALLGGAFLTLRATWEERTLERDLPGYREYEARVRSRFIPGIW